MEEEEEEEKEEEEEEEDVRLCVFFFSTSPLFRPLPPSRGIPRTPASAYLRSFSHLHLSPVLSRAHLLAKARVLFPLPPRVTKKFQTFI
ncbi:hypothetical protein E2C01_087079 [Portunus trituberculatus]|uniref:Uncharacterized protein n=1 Tax=Portunus trituberculatus TaxID=210409 RepID=A0A5B7J2F7_PORTR|nr:hypothetical protein [Portunus trituberculatus]